MFLSRILRRADDDRGTALVAVIALSLVTSVIAVTVGAVSVSAITTTNNTLGSVEARAAAEAGLNRAEALLRANACPSTATISSTTAPEYSVQIFRNQGAGWTAAPSCPGNDATQVRVISTGTAQRGGVGGGDAETLVLEAVFNHSPRQAAPPSIDPAVYAYRVNTTLKNFSLTSEDQSINADLQIYEGNFVCTNNAQVQGNVTLNNGYADLTSCTIAKSLHVSKWAKLLSSTVSQNVLAVGDATNPSGGSVVSTDRSTITGNIVAGGNVVVGDGSQVATVGGSVTAARSSTTSATVNKKATVSGNVQSSGPITNQGTVGGTVGSRISTLAGPPRPVVAPWLDLPYASIPFNQTVWATAAEPYREYVWRGPCTVDKTSVEWAALATLTLTGPVVVNALGCGKTGFNTSSDLNDLDIFDHVAFIAYSFNFSKLYIDSAIPGQRVYVHFIVPDDTIDRQPTCTPTGLSGNIILNSERNTETDVTAFAYSPCKIYSDRDYWKGQMYGGEVEFGQQAKMIYSPASPPGVNFRDGVVSQPPTPPKLDALVSVRELGSGG